MARPSEMLLREAWRRIKDFSGWGGEATYLWPRWLVLRAVGIVYLFVFGGIIDQGHGLVGPHGIISLSQFFANQVKTSGGAIPAFVGAPSFFWLGTSAGMVTFLGWLGVIAAIALVLNLWPRMALFVCWSVFLSFCAVWGVFSPAQLDNLMLETALLLIPFAPAGFRPGLGAASPPRPVAIFMVRWLLFRIMFESGIVKLAAGDPHWRNLTAMEVMYETSPFPTIFAYFDHHLPHAYHLLEIALTFTAELVGPVLAIFGGRRGRWFALAAWIALQAGIQLTSNFGWLNLASIGLGLLLLDDQMLISAAGRLRWRRLAGALAAKVARLAPRPLAAWRKQTLAAFLWIHFYITLIYFVRVCNVTTLPAAVTWPATAVADFRSVNAYSLYATFLPLRYQVEFQGSNDGGETWRTYQYRFLPQRVDEICPFIAPRFARFEATLQIECWGGLKSQLFPVVASHLLARNPDVMRLFPADPFAGRPPTMIRMRGYRLSFTDLATYRRTGDFWRREPAGDYLPMMILGEDGQISQLSLEAGDTALGSGNYFSALSIFNHQYQVGDLEAGFRLAQMYSQGLGVEANPAKVYEIYRALTREGDIGAENNLGVCYEYGVGVPVDYAQAAAWYRRSADHGNLLGLYDLGLLYAEGRVAPHNDVEALTLLLQALERARRGDPLGPSLPGDSAAQVSRVEARLTGDEIAAAKAQAIRRVEDGKFR